jgi:NAD(P)-dependent dehydrogenase (short-subunit alcohol dehydrogenase family)
MNVSGRGVLVTGSSRGVGAAAARAFAERGDRVAVHYRAAEGPARAVLESLRGVGHTLVQGDLADPAAVRDLAAAAVDALGRVDVLVNNAGIGTAVPATRETPEQFRAVVDVNLNGCYWMAQACGRVMQPGSSIVNISSVLGLTTGGLPQAAYSATKAALIGLTRDLAQQWTGRKGIRVNALAPGFFDSEMTGQYPDGYLDQALQRVPAGRKGEGAELAAALVFLVSDAGGYVTGQTLAVDGGMTIA